MRTLEVLQSIVYLGLSLVNSEAHLLNLVFCVDLSHLIEAHKACGTARGTVNSTATVADRVG
jgi:hypothetical protein